MARRSPNLARSSNISLILTTRETKPPAGSDERLRYTYWLHFAEGTAMPPLLIMLIVDRMESAKAPFFIKPVIRGIVGRVRKGFLDRQIASNLDFMEGELGKFEWFTGNEFTAADIQMSFPLEAASMRAGLDRSRPSSGISCSASMRARLTSARWKRAGNTSW